MSLGRREFRNRYPFLSSPALFYPKRNLVFGSACNGWIWKYPFPSHRIEKWSTRYLRPVLACSEKGTYYKFGEDTDARTRK